MKKKYFLILVARNTLTRNVNHVYDRSVVTSSLFQNPQLRQTLSAHEGKTHNNVRQADKQKFKGLRTRNVLYIFLSSLLHSICTIQTAS